MDNPNSQAQFYLELAVSYHQKSDYLQAIKLYQKALDSDPNLISAYNNIAAAYGSINDSASAITYLQKAIKLKPDYYAALSNLGNMYRDQNKPDQAIANYQQAIKAAPGHPEAHFNLGQLFQFLGDFHQAIPYFSKVLELVPDHTEAKLNLALAHKQIGNLRTTQQLLQTIPLDNHHNLRALYHLVLATHALDGPQSALKLLDTYDASLTTDPLILPLYIVLKQEILDYTKLPELISTLRYQSESFLVSSERTRESPGQVLKYSTDPEYNLAIATNWSAYYLRSTSTSKIDPPPSFTPNLTPKILFLSADFHDHATTHLTRDFFARIDNQQLITNIVSYGTHGSNPYLDQINRSVDGSVDIANLSRSAAISIMTNQNAAIAIDLKGHTDQSRLELFCHRLAPIHVSWLGFPGSTGSDYIDYLISDPVISPPAFNHHFSEKLIRMPHTYQVNSFHLVSKPLVSPNPNRIKLVSYNLPYKLSQATLSVWAKSLKPLQTKTSLYFLSPDENQTQILKSALSTYFPKSTLHIDSILDYEAHLQRFSRASLSLDPWPINGHTTTSDSLWSGVPVVTLLGTQFAGRVSASLLNSLGVPELITHTHQDYADLLATLIRQPTKLARIRTKLQLNRNYYPLFDTARFTLNFQRAMILIYDHYLSGHQPTHQRLLDPYPLQASQPIR